MNQKFGIALLAALWATSPALLNAQDIRILDSSGREISAPSYHAPAPQNRSRSAIGSQFDKLFPNPSSPAYIRARQSAAQQEAVRQYIMKSQHRTTNIEVVARAQSPDNWQLREIQLRRAEGYARLHSANNAAIRLQVRQATGFTGSYNQQMPVFTGFSSGGYGGGRPLDRAAQ